MPAVTSTNTNAPAIIIAEKGTAIIRGPGIQSPRKLPPGRSFGSALNRVGDVI